MPALLTVKLEFLEEKCPEPAREKVISVEPSVYTAPMGSLNMKQANLGATPPPPCHTAIATLLTLATFPSIRWPFAHSSPTLGHAGSIGAHQSSLLTTFAACPEHFGHQEWCQVFEIERPSN